MASSIKNVTDRAKLKPRREPYWEVVRKGCALGFRKITASTEGTWLARWRDPSTLKQQYHSLGSFDELPPSERRDAALKAAEAWLRHVGAGGRLDVMTVEGACRAYVDHVRGEKGDAPADEADGRFRRWVYSDAKLAGVDVTKLQPQHLLAWRKRVMAAPLMLQREVTDEDEPKARSKATVNRELTALRAALNHARTLGAVMTDGAWREALRCYKNADGRRTVYLDREQRKRWLEHAPADVGLLLRALSLVPLRPGALAGLNVADFDKRLGTLRVGQDKAGADRTVALPPATAKFFGDRAAGALPTAPLLRRADGKRWDKDAWKGPVKESAIAAGLPAASTAYTLRHSVITDLVVNGLDLLTIAQISGTSVAMIERHYGHLRAEHARQALATLAM